MEIFTFTFVLLLIAGAEWRLDPFVLETVILLIILAFNP